MIVLLHKHDTAIKGHHYNTYAEVPSEMEFLDTVNEAFNSMLCQVSLGGAISSVLYCCPLHSARNRNSVVCH